jgi:8-oxo-dGTP pyrophosphatase MutT (NUDIX family)
VLVRGAPDATSEPLEVYMIRRNRGMRFLGGYYAFPGGKVGAADGAPESLERCFGVTAAEAERILPGHDGAPALSYWVTAVRELLEETGILLACDDAGRTIDASDPPSAAARETCRKAVIADETAFAAAMATAGWRLDLRGLRYLSHFITPTSSPIRFTARFFLCRAPAAQEPRLFAQEHSEGFWIAPGEGYRRYQRGEMAMAEPAEYGLGYIAQFASLDELWAAQDDGALKFHGVIDRIDGFYAGRFDWKTNRFTS